jgi:hypothetical protein
MKAYRTLRSILFSAGTVLALDARQASTRAHVLYEMESGVYTAKEPITFKAGETIGLMTPPGKGDSGLEGPLGDWRYDPVESNTHDDDEAKAGENPGAALANTDHSESHDAAQSQESEAKADAKPVRPGKK